MLIVNHFVSTKTFSLGQHERFVSFFLQRNGKVYIVVRRSNDVLCPIKSIAQKIDEQGFVRVFLVINSQLSKQFQ